MVCYAAVGFVAVHCRGWHDACRWLWRSDCTGECKVSNLPSIVPMSLAFSLAELGDDDPWTLFGRCPGFFLGWLVAARCCLLGGGASSLEQSSAACCVLGAGFPWQFCVSVLAYSPSVFHALHACAYLPGTFHAYSSIISDD